MGTKYSKQCPISYEEAVRRISENEFNRLRNAFKRVATHGGTITKQKFVKEVLNDTFPSKLAEHIYQACGGGVKGLSFKELLSGLVLLTKGTREEKIRFIFLLYANEAGTYVQKDVMIKLVQEAEGGYIPEAVADCFIENDNVPYEDFAVWLLTHEDVTCLTRWLLKESCDISLSNDLDTPTFYQTLSGVTHLEENDIIELEKRYWILKSYSNSGKFDVETLTPLISPPLPIPLCQGLFNAFDENQDNHIDFKEMACGISACCRGPLTERQKFCFKVFDQDRDGFLNKVELETMITALLYLRKENRTFYDEPVEEFNQKDVDRIIAEILSEFKNEQKDDKITLEEYLVWTLNNPLPLDFTNLLFQICHIVLGLKPSNKQEESEIIRGWVKRENERGFRVGQYWYLINIDWWNQWNSYVDFTQTNLSNCDPPMNKFSSKKIGSYNLDNELHDRRTNNIVGTSIQNLPSEIRMSDSDITSNFTSRTNSTQSLNQSQNIFLSVLPGKSFSSLLQQMSTDSSKGSTSSLNQIPVNGVILPQKPPAVDNSPLIIPNTQKAIMLTGEGGRLRKNIVLTCGRDFEIVPEAIWRALIQWYGGSPALPRQVIMPTNGIQPELELYPITLQLYRHQTSSQSAASMYHNHQLPQLNPPKRYLAYIAAFSRLASIGQLLDYISCRLRLKSEEMRLWIYKDENNVTLLDDDFITLEELRICDNEKILIEVRNKDQTWPEEMLLLMSHKSHLEKLRSRQTERGLTGLNNLGNTCFMNAALQCVSNTVPLTIYFNSNIHLYELNRNNPLGMKGHIAKRYGDLVQDLWSGTSKAIAPLKLRWTIGKCAPRFNGFQQHDCQELLAFLLDGLHEDLNRVHEKPYTELKDSDGRPDVIVAQEAWENHILRNKSIVVDLFHGQLKSKVTCKVCGHTSVRFDPFNYLSLPLPMESFIHIEIITIKLDGSVPIKYGMRLDQNIQYLALKEDLSKLCNIPSQQLLIVEVTNAFIKNIPSDETKVRTVSGKLLYAYEIAPPSDFVFIETDTKGLKEGYSLTEIQRIGHKKSALSSKALNELLSSDENNKSDSGIENDDISSNNTLNYEHEFKEDECMRPEKSILSHACQSNLSSVVSNSPPSMTSSFISNSSQSDVVDSEHLEIVIAYHRKMIRQDVYFLSSQKTRPNMFGQPIIIPVNATTSNLNIYELVWTQISRLVSPLPPSESSVASNHAHDCDDSLGYEYPFTLKAVQKDGLVCAWCPWARFCRGCKIECNSNLFAFGSSHITIDWDATALHLRYQTSQEKLCIEHESVFKTRKLQSEPIDLNHCLEAFTTNEELGEEEKYYCSKCKKHQLAHKKLQMWRLPPVLIVHLKRFQLVHGHWVKSHKIVKFPSEKFCPTPFLASVPKHAVINALSNPESLYHHPSHFETNSSDSALGGCKKCNNNEILNSKERDNSSSSECKCADQKSESIKEHRTNLQDRFGSVSSNDGSSDSPQDFHQHRLKNGANPFSLNYNLYALSCHSGILGCGHYVCYAKNCNRKWYCYNDSSCKEVKEENIDTNSAYILFYEREGIDYSQYLPIINRSNMPDVSDLEDELETEFKKVCVIL